MKRKPLGVPFVDLEEPAPVDPMILALCVNNDVLRSARGFIEQLSSTMFGPYADLDPRSVVAQQIAAIRAREAENQKMIADSFVYKPKP